MSRILTLVTLVVFCMASAADAAAPSADGPLFAHWTFDGKSGSVCEDASGNKNNASTAGGAINRIPGVSGTAIGLAGNHRLSIVGKPGFSQLKEITFSAWVLPNDLSSYREIFRKEDKDDRVLFSFQDNGRILPWDSISMDMSSAMRRSIRPLFRQ